MKHMVALTEPRIVSVSKSPLRLHENFVANCKREMAEQNLSQVELTKRVNKVLERNNPDSEDRNDRPLTRPAVMEKINGTNMPGLEWVEIFARALSVSIDDLTT